MGQHDDIGQAGLFQHFHGDGGAGHLHQRQDAFLHPRATGGREQNQRTPKRHGAFGGRDDRVSDIHAHRPAHEAEILRGGDDRGAHDLALGHQHGFPFAGALLGGFHPVGVFLLIAELQRVSNRLGNLDLGVDRTIKQRMESIPWGDRHMMVAVRADI